jgi:hypothetical protein
LDRNLFDKLSLIFEMKYEVAAGDGMTGTLNWMAPEAMLSTGSFSTGS